MAVNADDAGLVKELLWEGEVVEETARQRGVGPGGSLTAPTSVVCTNKRLIIVNKATLGLRKDYEVIQYRQITSVRLEHGIISSSVFIRVQGYDRDKGLLGAGKEEGQIDGLRNKEARHLADYLNKKIAAAGESPMAANGNQQQQANGTAPPGPGAKFCAKCGHSYTPGSKFCENCGAKLT
jgi:hypothetical protein